MRLLFTCAVALLLTLVGGPALAEPFSEKILALLVTHAGMAGRSPYSFQAMPECGNDPKKPTCEIKRLCEGAKDFRCAAPRWNNDRKAWVRVETREAALRRYKPIAESIARVAIHAVRCRGGEDGSVDFDCKPIGWPGGPETLALVAATTAIWESGLREDIQFGYAPNGRGPDNEACLAQIMPSEIAQFAGWLPREERERVYKSGKAAEHEALAQALLGDSPEALDRCFSVAMRALSRSRRSCARQAGGHWTTKMWSLYGTGRTCSYVASNPKDDFPMIRTRTFFKLQDGFGKVQIDDDTRKLLGLVVEQDSRVAVEAR